MPDRKKTKEELEAMLQAEQQKATEDFSREYEALVKKSGLCLMPNIQIQGTQIIPSLAIVPNNAK